MLPHCAIEYNIILCMRAYIHTGCPWHRSKARFFHFFFFFSVHHASSYMAAAAMRAPSPSSAASRHRRVHIIITVYHRDRLYTAVVVVPHDRAPLTRKITAGHKHTFKSNRNFFFFFYARVSYFERCHFAVVSRTNTMSRILTNRRWLWTFCGSLTIHRDRFCTVSTVLLDFL